MFEFLVQIKSVIFMLFGISLACLVIWPFFVAKNFKKYFLYNFFYFITIAAFFFDQYTKKLAIDHLKLSRIRIPIIEDVLYFFYVENYGAAFGILQGKIIRFLNYLFKTGSTKKLLAAGSSCDVIRRSTWQFC